MTSVFIATPMYGGMCHGGYAASLAYTIPIFMNARVGVQIAQTREHSLVTLARDTLASDFLQTDCTHLMFIDADITFKAEDILKMMAVDEDVIGGLYPLKLIRWKQVERAVKDGVPANQLHRHAHVMAVYAEDGKDITTLESLPDEHFEVKAIGCGFMLIKRHVLEGLAQVVPSYDSGRFLIHGDCPHELRAARTEPAGCHTPLMLKQYFDTSIDADDNNLLLSEDYHFCKVAREHGFKVWAAPWVKLTHNGIHQFGYIHGE